MSSARRLHLFTIALLVAGALLGGPVSAGDTLYRWQDESGNPVLSDRPPPAGVAYETIRTEPRLKRVEGDEEAPPTDLEAAPSQGAAPETDRNAQFCQRARKNIQLIDSAQRISVPDGEGGRRYLTEEEIASEREKARADIAAYCEEQ